MSVTTVTEAQAGASVELHVGDELVIELPETPTSGFRWEVGAIDAGVLDPEGSTFEAGGGGALGGRGVRAFRFRVKTEGESPIDLKLWRAWEGEGSVVQRFEASVRALP